MRTPRLHHDAARFLDHLHRKYAHDRGALANLRGAFTDARRPNAWPLLAAFPGAIGNPAYETVAALWASGPDLGCATGNLGDTLARLKTDHNSFDGRFKRLLTCDHAEIPVRVVPVVRAAQAKGVSVNYAQLLSDLLWWNERVRVEWAKAFWGTTEPDNAINPDLIDKEEVPV
jgi:CRISPR system Cascade subunit CasB